jgi:NADH dehydrogenase/NADH:ubiquinone oxidoreductase subunit G
MTGGLWQRVGETERAAVAITVDGVACAALEGDTLLTAILTHGARVRVSEFGDGPRAGFCNMGACQDCWVWLGDGRRVRACTTFARPGMAVLTAHPASGGTIAADPNPTASGASADD